MAESIATLRHICQRERNKEYVKMGGPTNWVVLNLGRRPSIYLTKLFLALGVSANQVTLMSFVTGLAAGVLLAFSSPALWLVGSLLYYLSFVLDTSDGEIARYRGRGSPVGMFYDDMNVSVAWPFAVAGMSLGVFNAVGTVVPLVLGFVTVVSIGAFSLSPQMAYRIRGLEGTSVTATKEALPDVLAGIPSLLKYVAVFFVTVGLMVALPVISLADLLLPPLTLGTTTAGAPVLINVRYVYLGVYSAGWLVGSVLTVYYTATRILGHRG